MTIKTGKVTGRRQIRFEDLDLMQDYATSVSSRPGKTLGNWSVAQILDHLANSMRAAYEGPEVRAPWFVRLIIAPLIKPRFLSNGMPAGFALPKEMKHFMPDDDATTATALEKLRLWIDRLKKEAPSRAHPAFGRLTHADWIRLHLRHGELHLSFIIPD